MSQRENYLNRRLGKIITADGFFLKGASKSGKITMFRPALSNWRACENDSATTAARFGSSLA